MSFGEAIRTVLGQYAEFAGRATRPEYWWWTLFSLLVTSALSLFRVFAIGDTADLGQLLVGLWSLAVLLPSLAVAVRRLRDADYGWGHLLWLLVPVAGIVVLVVLLVQPTKPTAVAS